LQYIVKACHTGIVGYTVVHVLHVATNEVCETDKCFGKLNTIWHCMQQAILQYFYIMVYGLLVLSLLVAAYSIYLAYSLKRKKLPTSWTLLFLSVSLAGFAYLYGAWVYLSVYTKYTFGILYLLVLGYALLKSQNIKAVKRWKAIPNVFFGMVFSMMCILYFTGTTGVPKTVELQFPLKAGKYFVLQGGKGLPTNFFHYTYRGAIYAMDIVRLNEYGNRANHIFSSKLEDYVIYSDTIYSPCNGTIVTMHDDNIDNIPPSRKRGPSNTNMLVIDAGSYYVFMGHLRHNGVFAKEGQQVKLGEPLAMVGNSGFTLEPHLHIQAHAKPADGGEWYRGEPLLIKFDGSSYNLFETIRPRKVKMIQ
jgi:hypothetical protein